MTSAGRWTLAACPTYRYESTITLGATDSDMAFDVVKTKSGANIFVGHFHGLVDFDASAGVDIKESYGSSDLFVTRLYADGSYAWTRTVGGDLGDTARAVGDDMDDALYIVGSYFETVDFDPSDGVDEREAIGYYDAFCMKLTSEGAYSWTNTYGSTDADEANSVTIDQDGNAYVVGSFTYTVDFDPSTEGEMEYASNGGRDVFLTKVAPDGTHVWTRTVGGPSDDWANGVIVEREAVYVAGEFNDTVDFDPGELVDERTSHGSRDAFVSKYGTEGDYFWTWTAGGSGLDFATDVAVGADGCVLIGGAFSGGPVDFDPGEGADERFSLGSYDAFLTKLAPDRSYLWTHTIGGSDSEFGEGVSASSNGGIFVAGSFGSTSTPTGYTVDFDPVYGDAHSSNGGIEIFVTALDLAGNYQWTYTAGGISSDKAWGVDSLGEDLLVAGYFADTVDFDQTEGEDVHASAGSLDIFLTTLTCTDEPLACDGDANGDGAVDPLDVGFVLSRFGCDVGGVDPTCAEADVNGDLVVDPLDVGYVQARFGECP